MKTKQALFLGVAAAAFAPLLTACLSTPGAGSAGASDIGGVVTGPNGPEAGVWVIAETSDLPTKFAKVVVTTIAGVSSYPIFPRSTTACGCAATGWSTRPRRAARREIPSPDRSARAQRSRGGGILSRHVLVFDDQHPGQERISRHRRNGNGISSNIKSQEQWVDTVKNACQSCHSLGSKGMRTVPKEFGPGVAGWARRTQSGQALTQMALGLGYMGADASA